jgi:hypothetical protein
MKKSDHQKSRRDFLKKVGYTAPVILTMKAAPAFAKSGSGITHCKDRLKSDKKHDIFEHMSRNRHKKHDRDFDGKDFLNSLRERHEERKDNLRGMIAKFLRKHFG